MGNDCGCSCGSGGCCAPKEEAKIMNIDFLYLDLDTCGRCKGTDSNLDEAVKELSGVLKAAGIDAVMNKVNINTRDLAHEYEFVSSPTIRINGRDIALDVKESSCTDCGDICGDDVDCRVWTYNGVDYNEPPKELIVNAILKEIYGCASDDSAEKEPYRLPENLELFFKGKQSK